MNTIQLFTTILHVIREKTISCVSILNMIVLKHNIVYLTTLQAYQKLMTNSTPDVILRVAFTFNIQMMSQVYTSN